MMKIRPIYRLATLCAALSLAACTAGEDPMPVQKTDSADLTFRISAAPYEADWSEGGRAATFMDDEQQKKIHSLLYLFYRDDGHLSRAFYEHIPNGLLEVESTLACLQAVANKVLNEYEGDTKWEPGAAGGTLYILANTTYDPGVNNPDSLKYYDVVRTTTTGTDGKVTSTIKVEDWNDVTSKGKKIAQINTVADVWIDNVRTVGDFKKNTDIPLYHEAISALNSGKAKEGDAPVDVVADLVSGKPQDMVMFGMFEGRLDHMGTTSMSIIMGRIAARLRVVLTGAVGKTVRLTIKKAPLYTALYYEYPMKNQYPYYGRFQEVVRLEENDSTVNRMYYTGENRDSTVKTELRIEVWDNKLHSDSVKVGGYVVKSDVAGGMGFDDGYVSQKADRTYTIALTHDIPDELAISGRTNLYRNTSYTFNINLLNGPKTEPANSNAVRRRSVVMEEAGIIEVWPDE